MSSYRPESEGVTIAYTSIYGHTNEAVELLAEGKSNRVVGWRGGSFVDYDLYEALAMQKDIDEEEYAISKMLSQ